MNSFERLIIADIGKARGLKGWLWCNDFGGAYEQLSVQGSCFLRHKVTKTWKKFFIKDLQFFSSKRFLLLFNEVNTRTEAELFSGWEMGLCREEFVNIDQFPNSKEFYAYDLMGCSVVDVDGLRIGVVKDVVENSAYSMLVVENEQRAVFYVPFVEAVVGDVFLEKKELNIFWKIDDF